MARYTLARSLLSIFTATCLISGTATGGYVYYRRWQKTRAENDAYLIRNIIHPGTLKTAYLSQLLDLSCDNPTNLYALSLTDAASQLLESPVIERVELRRLRPSTLFVDYTLRKPIALVSEYSNTAIDSQGFLFPIHPFFTPKKLPEVILGLPPGGEGGKPWELGVPSRRVQLALDILAIPELNITRVDTSMIDTESVGRRQLVIVEDECIVRLDPDTYQEALANYRRLKETATVVDLRLPNLAYLQ